MNDQENGPSLAFEFDASLLWDDIIIEEQPQRLVDVEREKSILQHPEITNEQDYADRIVRRILEKVQRIRPNADTEAIRLFLYNRYGLTFI